MSSPTPWCSSYWKGSIRVALDYGHQLFLLYSFLNRRINITICCIPMKTQEYLSIKIYLPVYLRKGWNCCKCERKGEGELGHSTAILTPCGDTYSEPYFSYHQSGAQCSFCSDCPLLLTIWPLLCGYLCIYNLYNAYAFLPVLLPIVMHWSRLTHQHCLFLCNLFVDTGASWLRNL